MNLAVLGTDDLVVALIDAALAQEHSIVWLGDARASDEPRLAELRAHRLVPAASPSAEWEVLLDGGVAQGVIVGRGAEPPDLRFEQLKRLTAEGMPVLAVYPLGTSVLEYYEVDMIRHERGGVVRHYNPATGPLWNALGRWFAEGHDDVGRIHRAVWQRRVQRASREAVLEWLARDAEAILDFAGQITRVSASGPSGVDSLYASLQVQLVGPLDRSILWSVMADSSDDQLQVALNGDRGSVIAHVPSSAADRPPMRLETIVGGESAEEDIAPADGAAVEIERFVRAIEAVELEKSRVEPEGDAAAASSWDRATRAMEIVDAVELSLQKGRTIDVVHQELTETLAFRGVMSAMGCGLLVLSLILVLVAGLIGDALGIPLGGLWPILLLVVLIVFLLLQVVPLVGSRKQRSSAEQNPARR